MAKRKRLTPANPAAVTRGTAEKAPRPSGLTRAPIADVTAETTALASLEALSQKISEDRLNGRLVQQVDIGQIDLDYLTRDRVGFDEGEMESLIQSIKTRGQQTPVELVITGENRYGLISGWRRCEALLRLKAQGHGEGQVLALIRRPDTASEAYLSMVEENEVRSGLSYYERAHIVARAVSLGVFATHKAALQILFASASRAKRSKIGSFLPVVEQLGDALAFPRAIGERLGLQLSKALEESGFASGVIRHLATNPPQSAEEEQALLVKALSEKTVSKPAKQSLYRKENLPGLQVRTHVKTGDVTLSGKAMDEILRARLLEWLRQQTG